MLKHVQVSPIRNRADSLSIRSTSSCASSLCGSPEPPSDGLRSHSRASSVSSLSETIPQTTIKIYTACLRQDIEYKTLGMSWDTTSREVVQQLLRRCKMKHRDPRLFYLSMEITVRRPSVKTLLVLDDNARPALLQACHPKGDSRFCLKMKPGGLIRVHTSALNPNSQYKSLLISEETTSDELLSLLLSCYSLFEPVEQYSLYEVCPGQEYQRKLHPDDLPLRAQTQRMQRGEICHFLVRHNPNYLRRKQLNMNDDDNDTSRSIVIRSNTIVSSSNSNSTKVNNHHQAILETTKEKKIIKSTAAPNKMLNNNDNNNKMKVLSDVNEDDDSACNECTTTAVTLLDRADTNRQTFILRKSSAGAGGAAATKCQRLMCKSCEFCRDSGIESDAVAYSPVYNIREISIKAPSFSCLGIDKKLERYPKNSSNNNNNNNNNNNSSLVINKNSNNNEPVKKGFANFVYI